MGQQYSGIDQNHRHFIAGQKLFFVGTAAADGRINISPKGLDSLRVLDANRVVWLNLTGSANETSAHVQESQRMTLMFTSFSGNPMVLRLYGKARVVHRNDTTWNDLISLFPPFPGARQIFDLDVDLVQTSCGMGVPRYDYVEDREELHEWARRKGERGLQDYWKKQNHLSLDGRPTNIEERNM